jgi:hypothetical protein
MAAMIAGRVLNMMAIGFVVSFVTQMALMIYFSHEDEVDYSDNRLFWTVLIYSIMLGTVFMFISYYYEGDSFVLCKMDAFWYYKHSMKAANLGLVKGIAYLCDFAPYDDWGSLILDAIVMSIYPDKLLLNLVYMVLGAYTSLYLFRIGKHYMPEAYAFLAALGFGTSSFMVFFHCSFLKESAFVFLVVGTFYYIYLFMTKQSRIAIVYVVVFLVAQLYFRPAVAAMIAASIMIYYAITQKKNAISVFLYAISAGIFVAALADMQKILESNTQGGDVDALVEETNNAAYSGSFNYFVSLFGAVFGPFPSAFPKVPESPTWVEYYGAGLTYRLFLVFAFWNGIYMVFKKRVIELYPIVFFLLFELVITGLICASLELRKVILHIPFVYFLAFYGFSIRKEEPQTMMVTTLAKCSIIIGILFLWNVIRV